MFRFFVPILAMSLASACGPSGSGSTAPSGRDDPAQLALSPPPAFAVCSSCHAVAPDAHGVGPSLAGVWGRKAGSLPGYAYSGALKTSGIVWNEQTLDAWLAAPMKMVPGTRMVVGIPNPEARKAVIDYLRKLK
jgi:cytochrome c